VEVPIPKFGSICSSISIESTCGRHRTIASTRASIVSRAGTKFSMKELWQILTIFSVKKKCKGHPWVAYVIVGAHRHFGRHVNINTNAHKVLLPNITLLPASIVDYTAREASSLYSTAYVHAHLLSFIRCASWRTQRTSVRPPGKRGRERYIDSRRRRSCRLCRRRPSMRLSW